MTKSVLITGARSGMGRATALTLAGSGYRVFAGVRAGEDELQGEARARGVELSTVRLDVQDTASLRAAVAQVVAEAGGIDVLVNNAGYGLLATVEDGTDAEIFQQFDGRISPIAASAETSQNEQMRNVPSSPESPSSVSSTR